MKRNKELMRLLMLYVRDKSPPDELKAFTMEQQEEHVKMLKVDTYVRPLATYNAQAGNSTVSIDCLTEKGHNFLESGESTQGVSAAFYNPCMNLSVFISHSSKDSDLAAALIDFVQLSLNLPSETIRCTSVDGYRLSGGASTDETLKREVRESRVFIGLITPDSMKSAYVLFELGARWGAELPFTPLLARGASSNLLKGPLSGFNALSCDSESQMHQLIDEIARKLERRPNSAASYNKQLKICLKVAALASSTRVSEDDEPPSNAVVSVSEEIRHEVMRILIQEQHLSLSRFSEITGYSETRAKYFLSQLRTERFLIRDFSGQTEITYKLSHYGAEYVVNHNLDEDR